MSLEKIINIQLKYLFENDISNIASCGDNNYEINNCWWERWFLIFPKVTPRTITFCACMINH